MSVVDFENNRGYSVVMGRKRKEDDDRRTNVLRIRLTDDERRALDEAAQAKTLDTSTWARSELIALAHEAIAVSSTQQK